MNAKKIVSILFLSAATAALASCGGSNNSSSSGPMTRTQAVAVLNKMATAGTAQTKGVIDNGKGKVTNVGENFISTTYTADASVTVNSSTATVKANTTVTAWKDGDNYNYYMSDSGTDGGKNIYTTTDATLFAGVTKAITSYTGYATYAAKMAKYMGNFNDDGSAVTGGTAKSATLKSQSYSSTGDDNLKLDIVVTYSYDESLSFAWTKNLCTNYRGATCTWGSSTTTAPTDGTSMDAVEGVIMAATVIAAL